MYNKNLAIAIMMLSIFGDDLKIDENEQQGLVTLSNPEDDCYCTITKVQYDNLFGQLGVEEGEDNTEILDEAKQFNHLMDDDATEDGSIGAVSRISEAPQLSPVVGSGNVDLTTAETL